MVFVERMFQVEGTASAKAPRWKHAWDSLGLEVWLEWVEQEGGSVWGVGDLRGGGHEGSRFQRATAAMAKDLGFCSE